MTESKGFTIVSDGVVLAPFQKSDGSWGWYVTDFLMDSRTYKEDAETEILTNVYADTKDGLIEKWDEELDEMNDKMHDLSEKEGW